MPAHHAKSRPLVVANARHCPSYDCALRLDRAPFDALLGHAKKLSASEGFDARSGHIEIGWHSSARATEG